jgi:3-mercaptopyruvate sulfurtransferase SseA
VEILRQAMLVAIAGAATGLAGNALSPRPAPLGRPVHAAAEAGAGSCEVEPAGEPVLRVGVEEAKALCAACAAAFVDARGARDFAAGHVTGAIHLPPVGHAEEAAALSSLLAHPTVVVYDGDASCRLAEGVARRIRGRGHGDVRVLTGSWSAWLAAGGPGTSGACAACAHAPEARR